VSYCADDHSEKKLFAFIAKDQETKKHCCFVFLCDRMVIFYCYFLLFELVIMLSYSSSERRLYNREFKCKYFIMSFYSVFLNLIW